MGCTLPGWLAQRAGAFASASQPAGSSSGGLPTARGVSTGRHAARQPSQQAASAYLRELRLRDFALVDEQRVSLGTGLSAITGESGTGKSVLVAAVGQVLGAGASGDLIRPPATSASVEGIFYVDAATVRRLGDLLQGADTPQGLLPQTGGGDLAVRREISVSQEGKLKSRCFVNGSATTLRVVRLIGSALVDVNGQGCSAELRDAPAQLAVLDEMAGTAASAAEFARKWQRRDHLHSQLDRLSQLDDEEARDSLQRMADEIGSEQIFPGEEKEVRRRLREMQEKQSAVQGCAMVRAAVEGTDGEGVLSAVQQIRGLVHEILVKHQSAAGEGAEEEGEEGGEDEAGSGLHAALQEAMAAEEQLRSVVLRLDQYAVQSGFSQQDADDLSARAARISRLLHKYGCQNTEQLLARAAQAYASLEEYFDLQGNSETMKEELKELSQEAAELVVELGSKRRDQAARLRASVESCLSELGMAGARFEVRVWWEPTNSSSGDSGSSMMEVAEDQAVAVGEAAGKAFRVWDGGLDRVEYLFAAGPQEPLRPLGAVASGGEVARLMLALKAAQTAATAAFPPVPVVGGNGDAPPPIPSLPEPACGSSSALTPILVLDEIDSGVGARLGQQVGRLLQRMCNQEGGCVTQVLCVTHLPQVAAHAEHHLKVRKLAGEDGRVLSDFEMLEGEDSRVEEIAAMMGTAGDHRQMAEQMLRSAARGGEAGGNRPLPPAASAISEACSI